MTVNTNVIKGFILGLGLVLVLGCVARARENADEARLFDTLGGMNWENAMARLDNFAIELQNEPNVTGVIIVYGGQRRQRGESQAWANCLKDYLVNRRGLNVNRIVMVQGGYRESLTSELWVTLRKGQTPLVTPTPTIKQKNVRFRKGRVRKWRRLCDI